MLGLEFPKLDDEGVELGVGDLGVVEGVVALVVVADQGAQPFGPFRRNPGCRLLALGIAGHPSSLPAATSAAGRAGRRP